MTWRRVATTPAPKHDGGTTMASRAITNCDAARRRARDLRMRGLKLIEQAEQLSARIEAEDDDSDCAGLASDFVDPFDSGGEAWLTIAEASYVSRRRRDRFFPGTLFGEPAWDILLDLFLQGQRGVPVSISSACLAGGTAPTTGLRWLSVLEDNGLVERERNTSDGRMSWIRLSRKGTEQMQAYLADIVAQTEDWRRGERTDFAETLILAEAG